jgi:hypothetical protein
MRAKLRVTPAMPSLAHPTMIRRTACPLCRGTLGFVTRFTCIRLDPINPLTHARRMSMLQKIYEKNENLAVLTTVLIFIIFHFGMLYLFKVI